MKRPELLLLVLGAGAAGYFLLRRQQAAAPSFTVTGGQPQGGLGQLGATVGQALGAIPGIGPLLGAGAAVGGAGLEQWGALPEQSKDQVKRAHEKLHNVFIGRLGRLDPVTTALKEVGVIKDITADRRSKKKHLQGELTKDRMQREEAEAFAMAQANALSRPDVERWWIDQRGTTFVKYAGQRDPWTLAVPYYAQDIAAWAFEGVTRVLGAPVQGGVGPIAGTFQTYDIAGFDPGNPYAPTYRTFDGAAEHEANLLGAIARKHR